jgi:hypothetical protein
MAHTSTDELEDQAGGRAIAGDQRYSALVVHLNAEYGPLIGGADLVKTLGFRSAEAMRQAVSRKKLPVRTFTIPSRRGRFAYTFDVARWLAQQASSVDGGRP